jgi:hypothetical protein
MDPFQNGTGRGKVGKVGGVWGIEIKKSFPPSRLPVKNPLRAGAHD